MPFPLFSLDSRLPHWYLIGISCESSYISDQIPSRARDKLFTSVSFPGCPGEDQGRSGKGSLVWRQGDLYPSRSAQGWSWDSALTSVTAPLTCPQGFSSLCSVGHQVTAWHFDFVILPYPFPSFLLHAWMVTISDNDVTLEMDDTAERGKDPESWTLCRHHISPWNLNCLPLKSSPIVFNPLWFLGPSPSQKMLFLMPWQSQGWLGPLCALTIMLGSASFLTPPLPCVELSRCLYMNWNPKPQ